MALESKTAIVFGASQGIGLATARELARQGAVVILAARSPSIHSSAEQINKQHNNKTAYAMQCDVTDYAAVKQCIDFAVEQTGQLDIVVNNAGVIEPIVHLVDSEPSAWGKAIDINIKGVYHGVRAAAEIMKAQGHGTIINLGSGAANSILEGWSHYSATKAAVKKITEIAHKELHGSGVRVVGLSPGTVATDMMEKIRQSGINPVSQLDWSQHIPPEWPAKAIIYLCSPESDDVLGTDFSIKTEEGRARVGLI